MAKAVSPIRLQEDLMQEAKETAKRFHRSTAEQIEYWADLGRSVSSVLNPDLILSVVSGLSVIKTEPILSPPIDPDKVFQALESDRESGELTHIVSSSSTRYQASTKHVGFLERVSPDNSVATGQFKNGTFIILKTPNS